jgi:hypothetical protein
MTPKEKAKELVFKYLTMENTLNIIDLPYMVLSKQCALITVNEIIKSLEYLFGTIKEVTYYKEVKIEIDLL